MAGESAGNFELGWRKLRHSVYLWAAFTAFFWVVFLWGFWSRGVYALGVNATVFCLLLFVGINRASKFAALYRRENAFWLLPFLPMFLQFSIYENPYFKIINIIVIPIMFAFIYNYTLLKDRGRFFWDYAFIKNMFVKRMNAYFKLPASLIRKDYAMLLDERARAIMGKILSGLLILSAISAIVIVPLLYSADAVFAMRIEGILNYCAQAISIEFVMRVVVLIALWYVFISVFLSWRDDFTMESEPSESRIDDISSGVVLGGVLLLYALFIWTQLERLWIDTLP
ncbi:MAG: hypothetical protein HQL01_04655, partial [Nitrospirae bacterium]|nr:hypothetical protein [Nitrospirota bacterium]